MERSLRGLAVVCCLCAGLSAEAIAQPTTIQIVPGLSPGGILINQNYVPLSSFGGAFQPIAGFGDNSLVGEGVAPFEFGGVMYDAIAVASNGYIAVGAFGNGSEANQHFPDPAPPNGVLAPFWADLDPSAGGEIFIGALGDGVGDNWNVIDWENVPDANDPSLLNSFEIWLGQGNTEDISFAYGHLDGTSTGDATIGAENVYGTIGTNWFFDGSNANLPADQSALVVTTTGSPNLPEPSTWIMMGTGFAGLGLFARRRKRNRT